MLPSTYFEYSMSSESEAMGVICQAAHASCHAIKVEQTSRPSATRTLTCSGVRWLCQLGTGRAAWGCYHPWIGTILGTGPPPHPPLNIKLESTFGPTLIHWTETTAQCLRHTIENLFPHISLLLLLCYFAPYTYCMLLVYLSKFTLLPLPRATDTTAV